MIYTVPQLAKRWEVCELTIRNLIHRGKLKYFKTGRVYRIKDEWVKEYEEGGTQCQSERSLSS